MMVCIYGAQLIRQTRVPDFMVMAAGSLACAEAIDEWRLDDAARGFMDGGGQEVC